MKRPTPTASDAPTARFRVLATSDLHVHLLGYNYFTDRPCGKVGLARTAQLIERARTEVAGAILVDNGDFLQGNPLGDFIARERGLGAGQVHPVFAAMNALGYDAATLGNHEFNYGLEYLETALQGAQFPVVLANIVRGLGRDPASDQPFLPPYTLLTRDLPCSDGQTRRLRIGLIGFAPPQILQWDRALLDGKLAARGIVEAARVLVPLLRAAGAEVVVALSHSGITPLEDAQDAENASTHLAAMPGVDAVVAGHSHLVFPAPDFPAMTGVDPQRGLLAGKPAAMPGSNGSHLAVIDLDLCHGPGGWQVLGGRAEARAIGPTRPEAAPLPALRRISAVVAEDHRAALAYIRKPVGRSSVALHTFFATIAPNVAMRVVAEAQAQWVAAQLAGRPEADLPILSAVAPFKAGGLGGPSNYTDVQAGPLSMRHAADIYMFPNTVSALLVSGADLAEWLELSAGIYQQVLPGSRDGMLIDADFPAYNHDRILGLGYQLDLSQPARYDTRGRLVHPGSHRVRDLALGDVPITPGMRFVLATNSYRAAGSGGYLPMTEQPLDVGRAELREVLLGHLARGVAVKAATGPHFRFQPLGAQVLFDTAPRAEAFLHEIAHLSPEALGIGETGFLRLRLQI